MTNDKPVNSRSELPYATAKSLRILGKIRVHPEDFQVDEVPAYHPSGQGNHVFVRIRKRRLATPQAAKRLASALSRRPQDVSWAGLKDREAVTTQWFSVDGADPGVVRSLSLPGIEILDVARHPHKLRTGHLRANRFSIRIVCDPSGLAIVRGLAEELARVGVPNFYGEQRFGNDNLAVARQWLVEGGPPPRERFLRKLLVSALQAHAFNRWLAQRVSDGLFERPVIGDVMRREDSGGLFTALDRDEAERRMAAWEISPTGPIFGPKMMPAEDLAHEREQWVFGACGLDRVAWQGLRKLAPGTRRSARLKPRGLVVAPADNGIRVDFELDSGGYATTVLREFLKEAVGEIPLAH